MLKLKRQDLSVYQDGEFEFRPHEDGMYVYWNDLLPLLRIGREMAKVLETMALSYGPHPKEIQRFLTATAAIEEEKGVEHG